MKLKTFGLSMGETINMGNFNNVKYDVFGSIELTGEESEEELAAQIKELQTYLRGKAIAQRNTIKGS